jgi:hypothetical protein
VSGGDALAGLAAGVGDLSGLADRFLEQADRLLEQTRQTNAGTGAMTAATRRLEAATAMITDLGALADTWTAAAAETNRRRADPADAAVARSQADCAAALRQTVAAHMAKVAGSGP